jgi:hypothetical protein
MIDHLLRGRHPSAVIPALADIDVDTELLCERLIGGDAISCTD